MFNETNPPPGWETYAPDTQTPWNLARVVHLHRRAGFGMSWTGLHADLKAGPKLSIDRIVQARTAHAPMSAEAFDRMAGLLQASARQPGRLKAWWVYRMMFTPTPLVERMTLCWHNHFATSLDKVQDLDAMRTQNMLLRKHALGRFGDLLEAVVYDSALLIWLDAASNRKGHPNENLARELMELFTLGIGHYSERDVQETARALTGLTVADRKFRNDSTMHDKGTKTVLDHTGAWRAKDIVRLLLEHPATARRIAKRLSEMFFGENVLPSSALDSLAKGLRANRLDLAWGVQTILRSRRFFEQKNLRSRIAGPCEWTVGCVRTLAMFDAPPSTLLLADWMGRLGQDLFYPPNVGGWSGGRDWISPQTLIARANFVADLIEGRLSRSQQPFDALGYAKQHQRGTTHADLLDFYHELFFGVVASVSMRGHILAGLPSKDTTIAARRILTRLLASPEAQLT